MKETGEEGGVLFLGSSSPVLQQLGKFSGGRGPSSQTPAERSSSVHSHSLPPHPEEVPGAPRATPTPLEQPVL